MTDCGEQYFGKYRGTVVDNVDPKRLGRIQVSVPALLGDGKMSWAMPCVPYAGPNIGFFAIPPVDANVWVEFEGGDLDYPVWSGCFWSRAQLPAEAAEPDVKVFKTEAVTLELSDARGNGGFTLEVSPPAVSAPMKLVLDREGIEISTQAGSVKLTESDIEIRQMPAKLSLSSSSIEIKNGKSAMELSSAKVSINDGALEVE